jgi:hypothetical protein
MSIHLGSENHVVPAVLGRLGDTVVLTAWGTTALDGAINMSKQRTDWAILAELEF